MIDQKRDEEILRTGRASLARLPRNRKLVHGHFSSANDCFFRFIFSSLLKFSNLCAFDLQNPLWRSPLRFGFQMCYFLYLLLWSGVGSLRLSRGDKQPTAKPVYSAQPVPAWLEKKKAKASFCKLQKRASAADYESR
jgi:hypothetical protein